LTEGNAPGLSPNTMMGPGQTTSRVRRVRESYWDNGLYTRGIICGQPTSFLVDSGSTMTLLSSEMYNSLDAEVRPALTPWSTTIQGVGGIGLRTYGCALMNIGLGNLVYQQMVVVCDIVSDGILGQN
jgi:hypothetical protein